ncbi:MAG: hypothetical protein Q4A52_01015 [Bacillota bacterium]|nr:hypothetical protein [Bacillota bacterium]
MKNIQNFKAEKYDTSEYHTVEEGIYRFVDGNEVFYVTSLSFEQEPEHGEGTFADEISQYPLEEILDMTYCHINDFYPSLNTSNSTICYLEFASPDIDDVRKLRILIGKHIYYRDREQTDLVME